MNLTEHAPLPIMGIAHRPERFYVPKNDAARELIALVDTAEKLFPEQRDWTRRHWASRYKLDGAGFKSVVKHLDDANLPKSRSPEQDAHLEKMEEFISKTWP